MFARSSCTQPSSHGLPSGIRLGWRICSSNELYMSRPAVALALSQASGCQLAFTLPTKRSTSCVGPYCRVSDGAKNGQTASGFSGSNCALPRSPFRIGLMTLLSLSVNCASLLV